MFDFLRDDEKEVFFNILNSVKDYKDSFAEPKQIRKIVPIDQWVNDPYYVGPSGMSIYPYWKEQLIKIFDKNKNYNEIVIDGSLGTGKTTCANFCLLRKLYEISCYQNIPGLFGLMPGTIISFMYFSVSKTQAELTGYGQLKNFIDQSPYFKDYFKRNNRIQSMLVFPENILVLFGSEQTHCLMKGTRVATFNGIVKCEDLKIGDRVYNGENFKEVKNVYKTYGHTLRFTLNTGRQVAYKDNHLCYVDDQWVEAKNVSIGQKMKRVSGYNCLNDYQNVQVIKYNGPRGYDRNKFSLDEIRVDELWAEIFGWLTGDGSVRDIKHGIRFFGNREDKIILDRYKNFLDKFCRTGKYMDCNKNGSCIEFVCKCRTLFKTLESLGLVGSCYEKRIPEIIWKSPRSVQLAYIKGLWASDGSTKCRKTSKGIIPTIRYRSTSEGLIRDLQILMSNLGYVTTISSDAREFRDSKGYRHRKSWCLSVVRVSQRKFSEECCPGNKVFEVMDITNVTDGPWSWQRTDYETIVRIENIGIQELYGAEVEGEVYNSNGIITHNSIGLTMMGSVLDEANFRQINAQQENASSDHTKVATMYASIINRAGSRFINKGKNYSLSILVSSNTTASSFTEQRKKQIRNNENAYLINARLWDVKPKGTYDSKGFWVFVGSNVLDPMIVDTVEEMWQVTDTWNIDRTGSTVEECLSYLSDNYKEYFTWVPNDFRKQYEDNIIISLQDISGYSVAPSGRLFSSRPAYVAACNNDLEHPFTKNVIVLSTRDESSIQDWIRKDWFPLNRNKPRYIHYDQSLAHDRTGMASVYLNHWEKDKMSGIYKPYYTCDILMSVSPPKPPAKISIEKCMDLVYYMRDVWHLTIGMVSYDSYASPQAIQEFETNGIPSIILSVDRTEEQYMYLVNCILQGQIQFYNHPVLEKELFDLIYYRDKHKVNHPKAYYGSGDASNTTWGGSKDLTDGLCGALWDCYQSLQEEQTNNQITEFNDYVRQETRSKTQLEEMGYGDDIFNRVVSMEEVSNIIV